MLEYRISVFRFFTLKILTDGMGQLYMTLGSFPHD